MTSLDQNGPGVMRIGLLDSASDRLTARRAFTYFAIAYIAGTALLFVPRAAMPLFVVVPIALYSLVLIYAQTALYTRLNVTLKESPVFFGLSSHADQPCPDFLDDPAPTQARESPRRP